MNGYNFGSSIGWFAGENGCLFKASIFDKVNTEYTELCGIQIFKFIISVHIRRI